ncbi:helix-turn-helix domain-containing protein [Microcystis aeruginosa CS-558/01A06]|nr:MULTISPECIES: helix-turn-helix domain-containing protein [Microcystis]MDB9409204.1 helix-turn-helix domain-containing protein [Microcystis aeruginosa CS-558/01A06]
MYDSRTKAGLTQQQLADLIHVEKSVIEDLEDADYQDNPLIMLQKIPMRNKKNPPMKT